RMTRVLVALQGKPRIAFSELFTFEEGRRGVGVSLMAILELLKAQVIEITQAETADAVLFIRMAVTEAA
ncbi:MAG TPA: segregation/condensation protein A, partial [Thiolinea sp.]|nr:segregation/condensation protein A [Thiolinea sp.]